MTANPLSIPVTTGEDQKRASILVVDDEQGNVTLLTRILARAGFNSVHGTTSPLRAIGLFAEVRPDIVLLDMHMPGLDGIALMQRLQATLDATDFVPVIMLTADPSTELRKRALAEGAMDFVTKPFEGHEVLLRIRNLLHMRRLHRELRSRNELLELRVHERTAELEQARLDILDRLARAADFRDDQTGEHTRRVGFITEQIAAALSLEPEEASRIGRAAMLHDIGKIGIPDEILLKPGRLTPEEFAVIRRHTRIGRDILAGSPAPLLQVAETIAFTHHERWDGGGYEGMVAAEIPLEGRIVTVADTFDVLTNARPYRKPCTVPEALAEMRSQRGKQFDPDVLDAFLSVVRE